MEALDRLLEEVTALRGDVAVIGEESRERGKETTARLNKIEAQLIALRDVDAHTANEVARLNKEVHRLDVEVRALRDELADAKRSMLDGDKQLAAALTEAMRIQADANEALRDTHAKDAQSQAEALSAIQSGISGLVVTLSTVHTKPKVRLMFFVAMTIGAAVAAGIARALGH